MSVVKAIGIKRDLCVTTVNSVPALMDKLIGQREGESFGNVTIVPCSTRASLVMKQNVSKIDSNPHNS